MTLGVVVQNGKNDYYITSYFHAIFFLKLLTGTYEQFLHEVMNDRYIREMVGGVSGLGSMHLDKE